jgi:hypothetical protein
MHRVSHTSKQTVDNKTKNMAFFLNRSSEVKKEDSCALNLVDLDVDLEDFDLEDIDYLPPIDDVKHAGSFLSTIVARRPTAERTNGSRNAAVDTFVASAALTTELPPRWAVLGWRRLQEVSVVCRARRRR